MTMSPPSTLHAAPLTGRESISPMFPGVPKLDLRVEAVSTDPSISNEQWMAIHVLGEQSRSRATPTRASSSATGLAARTRAARPGLPIT